MVNNSGWIKLHRSLLEWEWYKDLNTRSLFLHFLLRANHKDNKFQGNTIKRGQLLTGINALSFETSLSVQQLRTSLKKLKSTNDITIETTSKNSVITIVNYDFYQSVDDDEQVEQQTNNKQVTSKQQTSNKRATTNKNDKNIKNDKNVRNIDSLLGADAQKNNQHSSVENSINSKKEKSCAKKEKEFGRLDFRQSLIDLGADANHVDDWIKVRSSKKAVFTTTALQGFLNECNKNNFSIAEAVKICAENSWQGFKYSWVQNLNSNGKQNTITTNQSRQQRVDEVANIRNLAKAIISNGD